MLQEIEPEHEVAWFVHKRPESKKKPIWLYIYINIYNNYRTPKNYGLGFTLIWRLVWDILIDIVQEMRGIPGIGRFKIEAREHENWDLFACSSALFFFFTRSQNHFPMADLRFSLNASTTVSFTGDVHVHGLLAHQFSGTKTSLSLMSRARQFFGRISRWLGPWNLITPS